MKATVSKNVFVLNKAMSVLDYKSLQILYCWLISPYLKFCVELWAIIYVSNIMCLFWCYFKYWSLSKCDWQTIFFKLLICFDQRSGKIGLSSPCSFPSWVMWFAVNFLSIVFVFIVLSRTNKWELEKNLRLKICPQCSLTRKQRRA